MEKGKFDGNRFGKKVRITSEDLLFLKRLKQIAKGKRSVASILEEIIFKYKKDGKEN